MPTCRLRGWGRLPPKKHPRGTSNDSSLLTAQSTGVKSIYESYVGLFQGKGRFVSDFFACPLHNVIGFTYLA